MVTRTTKRYAAYGYFDLDRPMRIESDDIEESIKHCEAFKKQFPEGRAYVVQLWAPGRDIVYGDRTEV